MILVCLDLERMLCNIHGGNRSRIMSEKGVAYGQNKYERDEMKIS